MDIMIVGDSMSDLDDGGANSYGYKTNDHST